MDDQKIERIIRTYLPQVIHMSLATVGGDGRPYVCELHYAYDDQLNLYWMSAQQVRHSREVAADPRVAGNIVTQHHLEQLTRGVYFEGAAELLEDVGEDHIAYRVYAARFADRAPGILPAYTTPEGPRLYKLTVKEFHLVDGYATGRPQRHDLAWRR